MSGFKTFAVGAKLTASDVNSYLMEQSVMVFGSTSDRSTALPSPTEGMFVYITNVDQYMIWNGSAWVIFDISAKTYTPTFTNFTLGNGSINQSRYFKIGKLVHLIVDVTLGSTSSVTGQIQFSTPTTMYGSAQNGGNLEMTIGGTTYGGMLRGVSTTVIGINAVDASSTYTRRTATSALIPGTWATGSRFSAWHIYEEA